MSVAIEARGIGFGDVGIDLKIQKGERWAILGPNTPDKIRFVNILSGRIKNWNGELFVSGHNARQGHRAPFGVVPFVDDLDENLTIFENLQSYLDFVPTRVSLEKCWELLQSFQLEDQAHHQVTTLSHFDRKRIMLVRALLPDPDILILESPTCDFEAEQMSQFWGHLEGFRGTVVLSTESGLEVERYCSHLLIYQAGQSLAQGSPEELIRKNVGTKVVEIHLEREDIPYFQSRLSELNFSYRIQVGKICVYIDREEETERLMGALTLKQHQVRNAYLRDVCQQLFGDAGA